MPRPQLQKEKLRHRESRVILVGQDSFKAKVLTIGLGEEFGLLFPLEGVGAGIDLW